MNKTSYWLRLFALGSVSAMAGAAHAQTAEVPADTEEASPAAGEIIVTAQKRSERLNDVPMAITAATGDDLAARGVTSIEDLAKVVPGFQYTHTTLNPVYTLRGVGFFDTSFSARGAVAVYNDEIGLPFGVMTQGIPFDLERVEVLKGPQGTLYGQNSTGGAINYISAKPTDSFKAGISGEIGRFRWGYVEAFASGPITDTLNARVAVHQDFGGDWQRGFTNDRTSGSRNAIAGRFLLDWKPTDRLRISSNFTVTHIDSDPQMPQISSFWSIVGGATRPPALVGYPLPSKSNRAADFTPGQAYYKRDQMLMGAVRLDYDLSDTWQVTSLSSYADYDRENRNERDGTTVYNNSFANSGGLKVFQQELRLSGEMGDRVQLLAGLNYERDKAVQIDVSAFTDGSVTRVYNALVPNDPFLGNMSDTRSRYTSKAIFGNAEIELTPTLTAQLGARYTDYRGTGSNCTGPDERNVLGRALTIIYNGRRAALGLPPIAPIQAGQCVAADLATFTPQELTQRLKENNVSWRVGIDWKPSPDFMLYGNVSRGYKGGSFPSVLANFDFQFAPALQEALTDYEVGFKASLFDRTLQVNGGAFYYDYQNKQVQGRIINSAGSQPKLVNIPASRLKGTELEIHWSPSRHFTLGGGITYLDSRTKGRFVNFEPQGTPNDFGGERFPYAPKWQGTVDAEYRVDLGDRLEMFAGASLRAQSRTVAAFGDNPNFDIDGYALLDLRLGIEDKDAGWRVALFGRNVTDTTYWTSTIRGLDTNVRYMGMPATYGISFSFKP
ncbi:TonB-dependent receptor [Sphingopyxis sp. CCNWLW253]|uniref:TonB-dependent receptor n=1 Tax=unclassified Sphingopyxis TaxID=2614943 RepID=UPI003012A269